jgi:hypothetical protein
MTWAVQGKLVEYAGKIDYAVEPASAGDKTSGQRRGRVWIVASAEPKKTQTWRWFGGRWGRLR